MYFSLLKESKNCFLRCCFGISQMFGFVFVKLDFNGFLSFILLIVDHRTSRNAIIMVTLASFTVSKERV